MIKVLSILNILHSWLCLIWVACMVTSYVWARRYRREASGRQGLPVASASRRGVYFASILICGAFIFAAQGNWPPIAKSCMAGYLLGVWAGWRKAVEYGRRLTMGQALPARTHTAHSTFRTELRPEGFLGFFIATLLVAHWFSRSFITLAPAIVAIGGGFFLGSSSCLFIWATIRHDGPPPEYPLVAQPPGR